MRTLAPGDSISGATTGLSTTVAGAGSADYFDVSTTAAPSAGIWRYRLTITNTGTAGHTGSIRGLQQLAAGFVATSDFTAQTSAASTTPSRFNQWYANENPSRIIYRMAGTATTLGNYTATLSRDPVVATPIVGSISAGPVTITTIGQTTADTDLWVYTSAFTPIAGFGNDDESIAGGGAGTTLQSLLTRTLTPGNYILAISLSNLANNQPSPTDEDFFGTGLDFPNALTSSTAGITTTDVDFTITSSAGTIPVTAIRSESYGVRFFSFTVDATVNPIVTACAAAPSVNAAQGSSVTLSTNVTFPGAAGTVTADLSSYGLSSTAALTNNGGGNYSIVLNVPGAQSPGPTPVTITATNPAPGLQTATCSIPLVVTTPPPANDLCSGAIVIPNTSFPATVSGDNTSATTPGDRTVTAACSSSVKQSVWFAFTAPTAGSYVIDTEGSGQTDTILAVFADCGPAAAQLACDDDGGTAPPLGSRLSVTLTAGQNVRIQLSTYGGLDFPATAGAFTLNIAAPVAPPANDDCATAITIPNTGLPLTVTGDNSLALSTNDRTSTCEVVKNSVWYDFTAPATGGSYLFDTEGSIQLDTLITIFTSCTGTEINCDGESGTGSLSSLAITLAPNQNIKIMVSTWGAPAAAPGIFNLNVADTTPPPPPPANDTCAGAEIIPTGTFPVTVTTDNTFATNIGDIAPTCQTQSIRGVWYQFTAPTTGNYTFHTEASVVTNTILAIIGACDSAQIACDDDSGLGSQASTTIALTAGQTVRIQVSAFSLLFVPTGNVSLTVFPDCVTISTQPTAVTACETQSASFTVAATSTGPTTFQWQSGPSATGPWGNVVDGPNPGFGTFSGATSASLSITGLGSSLSGTFFRASIGGGCGADEPSTAVALTVITGCPANDSCLGALPAIVGTTTGDNANASSSGDPIPSCQLSSNKGVWYTFTAPAAGGTFIIDTEGSAQTDTVLTVFASCGGAELACDDDGGTTPALSSRLIITLAPNQSVRIQVSSFGAAPAGGGFNLNISDCTVFTTQPIDTTVDIGAIATFTAAATGPGTLTFIWERQLLGAGLFTPVTNGVIAGLGTVSGADTAVLTITGAEAAASTDKFRLLVTSSCNSATSAVVTLTVGSAFPPRCNGADIAYDNNDFLPR
ncbi:MAG: hypothetical protein K2X32_07830, partial [Phycisphaerales bacterium]|nr:hypothetical protein [Phycisphaerales bacterium]